MFGMMRRIFTIKHLWVLANLICTALLTVQLAHILEAYIKPTMTRTWEEEVSLRDIEFPLVVKICIIPGFNQTALREVGYEDTFAYFLGLNSSWNSNYMFGWAGHPEDSGTFGTVEEILAKVIEYEIENIIFRIHICLDQR